MVFTPEGLRHWSPRSARASSSLAPTIPTRGKRRSSMSCDAGTSDAEREAMLGGTARSFRDQG